MQRYIAFLRGINLGRRRLKMDRLQSLVAQLGFSDVATFIASGNVVFATRRHDPAKLEQRIAQHLGKSLGYDVDTFVRTDAEVAAVVKFNPFPGETGAGTRMYVAFLHEALCRETAQGLVACRTPHDEFCVRGREFYWLCRVPSAESTVWASPAMKALRLPSVTMRNITSLQKLVAQHGLNEGD